MSSSLLYGADQDVAEWASERLFGKKTAFQKCKAIGILVDNKMICGVVYNNLYTDNNDVGYSIEMSIASVDKRWATRHNLRAIFAYPFIQLGLKRAQILTSVSNEGVNSIVSRLGYKKEGYHREAYPDGSDAYSWGMLKSECIWI